MIGYGKKKVIIINGSNLGNLKKCLEGIEKDGRKRAVFILINYLRCNGWKLEDIQKLLLEWNKKNTPPLSEKEVRRTIHSAYKRRFIESETENDCYIYYVEKLFENTHFFYHKNRKLHQCRKHKIIRKLYLQIY